MCAINAKGSMKVLDNATDIAQSSLIALIFLSNHRKKFMKLICDLNKALSYEKKRIVA